MLKAKLLMILGIAMLLIGGATHFFVLFTGPVRYVFTIIQLSGPLLLLGSALLYRRELGRPFLRGALGLKMFLLVLTIGFLSIYGMVRGNSTSWIIRDCWPYAVIFASLLLGRFDRVIEDIEKPLSVAFWVCLAMVLLSLKTPQTISAGFFERAAPMAGERASVESVGYKVADTLGMWPLVFLLGYLRPRLDFWKIAGIAAALAWIGLQVHFQKRAPFVRGMTYIAIAVVIIPFLQKRLKLGTAFIFLAAFAGFMLVTQRGASFQRLMIRYEEDPALFQSSRWMEARSMLEDIRGAEWLFGKGMGGGFKSPWKWTLRSLDESSEGQTLHVGFLMPLLKGGALLLLVFYLFFIPLFTKKPPGWYASRANVVSMAIVPVFLVFLLAEGGVLTGSPFDPLMMGLICARGATVGPLRAEQEYAVMLSEEPYGAFGSAARAAY